MNVLERFHNDNAFEYKCMLKYFNLIFFGYGCKEKLLSKLFPGSLMLNCHGLEAHEVAHTVQKFIIKTFKPKNQSKYTLMDIGSFFSSANDLFSRTESFILILINFRKEFTFLINTNIKIIGTIEKVIFNLTYDDINDYNFIFRDLTTFKPYGKEILEINLDTEIKKFLVVENLLNSVSKKAGDIFIATIKNFQGNTKISFPTLINKVGKKFLITSIPTIKDHLHEFFDHKVLKNTGHGGFIITLSKCDIKKILEIKRIQDS